VAQISVAVFLLLVLEVELKGYMIGFVAVQSAYCLLTLFLVFLLVTPRFTIERKLFLDIVVLAAPIGLWSIFNAVSTRADIFMLSYLQSADDVGIYNAAYRLLDLGTAVAATVAVPLVPVLTRKFGTNFKAMRTTAARVFELTVVCTIPIPVSLMFIASPLVELTFGEAFSRSAVLLPIFGWLFIMLVLMYVGNAINLTSNNIRHASWSAAIAAAINIVANLFLIPRYGVLGAAWSSALSTLFMFIVSMAFVRINVGNVFEARKWIKIGVAAAVPYGVLMFTPDQGVIIRLFIAAAAYVLALLFLRLLPFEYLVAWRRSNAP
jgi:O-antigen/teichoic acid export membrane protein